ncbi:MAG: response regulator [Candidatus Omnitrophica bacterium]|nr:response regulator [Candidatus Omnitrophota bacterium]
MGAIRKILVIDDEPDSLVFLTETLQKLDYQVITAETGEIGLKRFFEEKPDLIILDVLLPSLDGWDVLERIRTDQQGRKTPVIMLTVRGTNKDKLHGYIIGADYYLAKPFTIQALLQAINTVKTDREKQEGNGPRKNDGNLAP